MTVTCKLMFERLFWGHARLRDYERTCLNILRENLSEDAALILDEQLRDAGLIQRWTDRMLVFKFNRCPQPVSRFPNRKEAVHLGRVTFQNDEKAMLQCNYEIHEGYIFSLSFNKEPRPFFKMTSSIKNFKMFEDVMASETPTAANERVANGPVLSKLAAEFEIKELVAPMSTPEIAKFSEIYGAAIPQDWLPLVQETNGFRIGAWGFNGLNARRMVVPEGIYVALIESETLALCFAEGADKPLVLLRDQVDESDQEMGESFIEALKFAVINFPDGSSE